MEILQPLESFLEEGDYQNYRRYLPQENPTALVEKIESRARPWIRNLSAINWKELSEAHIEYRNVQKGIEEHADRDPEQARILKEQIDVGEKTISWFNLYSFMENNARFWELKWAREFASTNLKDPFAIVIASSDPQIRIQALQEDLGLPAERKEALLAEARRQLPYYTNWRSRLSEKSGKYKEIGHRFYIESEVNRIGRSLTLARAERHVYEGIYRNLIESKKVAAPSACRDFTF